MNPRGSNEPPEASRRAPGVRRSRVRVKKSTPSSWTEETRGRRSASGNKRSASWGSAEHLREVAKLQHQLHKRSRHAGYEAPPPAAGRVAGITQTIPMVPLNRIATRLRRSVEGLNLELEEVFVSDKPDDDNEEHEISQILDIPDGHRAPAPVQRCSSGSQTSVCSPSSALPSFALSPPLLQHCSSAPRPNRTYPRPREPPEGCEREGPRVDPLAGGQNEPLPAPSCPDLNKVNFTPHGGSAFCPVSLLKPLLPSMDLLFRGLSVSPVTGCPGPASPARHLGMQ